MVGKAILHYKIKDKLGEGGMGIVYKAEDSKLKRDVAIKFLPVNVVGSNEERDRFRIEAQAAAALNHPHIATIHAIEEADKEMFMVMEYIDGQELKTKIDKEKLTTEEALKMASAIAEGLSAAHSRGVIHRDIKSSNIMLTSDGNVKIMDFGLAKIRGSELVTRIGTTLGTAAYMSPEQARGESVDHRTDLWSLGIILYEMLTGKLPFQAEHEAAWTYLIVNERPLLPSEVNDKIPEKIDSIVMRLLEKEKEKRYQDAAEIVQAIRDYLGNVEAPKQEVSEKAIAVLPFENMSPDKETDYFANGLAEELIVNLSGLKNMRVIPRTTSIKYKGSDKDVRTIGRELGCKHVLVGSVRKHMDNLRISVQLIDIKNDKQLWAETFKGKIEDVFDIQEEVSKQILEALKLKLTPNEKVILEKRSTLSAEAFDYNLRARNFLYQMSKSKHNIAMQLYKKAIELDPRYAQAHAGLGETYASYYQYFDKTDSWLDKAIESSMRALVYDASLSEAYSALSLCYFMKQSFDEALESSRKAIDLDPNNYSAYWTLGRIFHSTDRDKEAVDYLLKVIEINPDFYTAYADLCIVYENLGEIDKYKEIVQKALDVYPRYLLQFPDDARAYMFYAIELAQVDKVVEAKKQAAKAIELNPKDPLMLYNAACFYSRINEKSQAIDLLKSSLNSGYADFEWLKRDSDLENIKQEKEYLEILKVESK